MNEGELDQAESHMDPLDRPMKPLKITCTSTDCGNDLHCFLQPKRGETLPGPCRSCGEDLVDWPRVHKRDPSDIEYLFESLRKETMRHRYWGLPFDADAMRKAKKQGRRRVLDGVRSRLRSSVGRKANGFDSRQTGLGGRVVYYAQHATATCCRKCIEYWYDIPSGRDLTSDELDFCETLVSAYLCERLTGVSEEGTMKSRKPRLNKSE